MPIIPCGFDEQSFGVDVPGLGDGPFTLPVIRGLFGGYQSEGGDESRVRPGSSDIVDFAEE